ncbi:fimbrial protein [Bacteroides sp. An51A]|uniref:fimbrial protein n=1 Tax=Bacteroides sp. An51A TaxID=1965640 RepID=UPI001302E046|nr:fimbrial protein [Bacteroides sp. An51A]
MKTYIRYLLISLPAICGLFSSCTDDMQSGISAEGKGKVTLTYSISGITPSRAEAGVNDDYWNENQINRLDLFIFPAGGGNVIHQESTPDVTDGQDGSVHTWVFAMNDLSPENIAEGDQIYLIANCPSVASVTTLQGLQEAYVQSLTCNAKQTSFLMDGKGTLTRSGNDATIQVELKRALAKIRLTVTNTYNNEASYEYQFVNYAPNSAVLEEGETAFLVSNNAILQSTTSSAEDEMIPVDGAQNIYDGKLILYSYANNWYEPHPMGENDDINDNMVQVGDDQDNLYTEAPIDPDKQTYILLKAPFNGKDWYYKVPVNYQLPEDNDAITPDESYKDLYRLQRNYIYDIAVTIDREGGSRIDPGTLVNLTYSIMPWDGEEITVDYTDNLSYTSAGWTPESILEIMEDGLTVHVNPDENAELKFTINTPSGATWRAQLIGEDVNYFEFVGENSGTAYSNGQPVEQTLQIRCTDPESEDTHSVTLRVFADIGGKTYELDLTDPNPSMTPGQTDEINRFTILQSR